MDTQLSSQQSSSAPSKRSADTHKSLGLSKSNQVGTVMLYGIPIVSLFIESQERLCLAQISNTLLKQFSYNEIHNRRVALGITCVQCTPVQLEILRRAGAMPVSSRRCGMITRREAERLCKSFLGDNAPPRLPDDFAFSVIHECAWGCRGSFMPSRYNSSRAKCIKCFYCGLFFSPNKFIFHSHRIGPSDKYVQPDAANFNSWRRHLKLFGGPPQDIMYAWEDVKAMFNGGTRKRVVSDGSSEGRATPQQTRGPSSTVPMSPKRIKLSSASPSGSVAHSHGSSTPHSMQSLSPPYSSVKPHHIPHSAASLMATSGSAGAGRLGLPADLPIPFSRSFMMDYMWHHQQNNVQQGLKSAASGPPTSNIPSLTTTPGTPPFPIPPYAIPWLKRPSALFFPPVAGNGVPSELPQTSFIDSKAFSFYNNSAFKPVNGQSMRHPEGLAGSVGGVTVNKNTVVKEPVSSDEEEEDNHNSPVYKKRLVVVDKRMPVQQQQQEAEDEEDEDEILVDIETTEDDDVQLKAAVSPREVKEDPRLITLSPQLYSRPHSASPTILHLDPNNNTREDPLKRSSRATPNHMPGHLSSSGVTPTNHSNTSNATASSNHHLATPLKEDSPHSKSSSYSPLSQSSSVPEYSSPSAAAAAAVTAGGVVVNAPILSPSSSNNNHNHHHQPANGSPGELWSVARLTALERNAAVAVAAAEQSIHSHSNHHHPHHQPQHLNGYYQGENLIISKASSGSSVSPVSMSPPIYSHHALHGIGAGGGGSSASAVAAAAAIQKPIATFYRHELAKQFHLYRSHHHHSHLHNNSQQHQGAETATGASHPNGVV